MDLGAKWAGIAADHLDVELVVGLVIGLAGGSSVNALYFRLLEDLPLFFDRSRCPSCRETIAAYDNIPVISYLILRGRCRKCGSRIPASYPLVELAGAAIGVAAALLDVAPILRVAVAVSLLAGLAAAMVDLASYRIPNRLTYPGIVILALLDLLAASMDGEWNRLLLTLSLFVAGLAFFLYLRLLSRGGMGVGDAKLFGLLALGLGGLGWKPVLIALVSAFGAGAVVGVGAVLAGRRSLKSALPFGPFITLGCYASVVIYLIQH